MYIELDLDALEEPKRSILRKIIAKRYGTNPYTSADEFVLDLILKEIEKEEEQNEN